MVARRGAGWFTDRSASRLNLDFRAGQPTATWTRTGGWAWRSHSPTPDHCGRVVRPPSSRPSGRPPKSGQGRGAPRSREKWRMSLPATAATPGPEELPAGRVDRGSRLPFLPEVEIEKWTVWPPRRSRGPEAPRPPELVMPLARRVAGVWTPCPALQGADITPTSPSRGRRATRASCVHPRPEPDAWCSPAPPGSPQPACCRAVPAVPCPCERRG